MEAISFDLQSALTDKSTQLVELYEIFTPEDSALNPTNAVARFSSSNYFFNGLPYERKIIGRGDITSTEGKQTNQVSVDLVNVDGWLSNFLSLFDIEGYWLQIRLVSPRFPNESLIIFGGKIELPEDVGYLTGTINVVQDVYGGNAEIPQRTQSPQCGVKFKGLACRGGVPIASKLPIYQAAERCNKSANQCSAFGNRENYAGTIFTVISGSFGYVVEEVKRFLLFFKKKKKRTVSATFSSVSDAKSDTAIPLIFGTTQVELLPVMHADTGANLKFLSAACEGEIEGIYEARCRDKQYQSIISSLLIALGKFGSNGQPDSVQFPGAGKFSGTAWLEGSLLGSDPSDANDSAPTISAIIRGQLVDVPNPLGGYKFDLKAWSDCGPYIVRYLLKTFGDLKEWQSDDESFIQAAFKTFEPVIDDTGIEQAILPRQIQGGVDFKAFASASGFGAKTVDRIALLMAQGKQITGGYGQLVQAYYVYINQQQPPTFIPPTRKVRRRYTTNVAIDTKTELSTILEDLILPSFNGKLVASLSGQTRLKIDAPVPSGYLRAPIVTIGATALQVDNILAFQHYKGQILVGAHQPTAEVASVAGIRFDIAGNSLTLAAVGTGGITATISGATFAGGSTTMPAVGLVTLSGTIAAGNSITITINGTAVSFTAEAGDDIIALAGYMAAMINGHWKLKRFIKAEWSDTGVIRLVCKYGFIDLREPLTMTQENDLEVLPITAKYSGSEIALNSFKWHPGSYFKSTNRVKGAYRAAVNDWAETSIQRDAEVHQDRTKQINEVSINLSAVDNGHQAARHCKIALGKLYVCREKFSFDIGRRGIPHEQDDLICFDYAQGNKVFRNIPAKIISKGIKENLQTELKVQIYRSEIYDDTINELTPQILLPLDPSSDINTNPTPPNPIDPNPPPDILIDPIWQPSY